MSWRRGFFRIWLVASALFVIAIAAISYSEIMAQFDATAVTTKWPGELMVPTLCGKARGVEGTDFQRLQFDDLIPSPNRPTQSKPNYFDTCWYRLTKFRPLYPEYNDLSDEVLSSKLYAEHGIPLHNPKNPWTTLLTNVEIALGIPLIVLILGSALTWAFSGFKRSMPR